MFSTCGTLQPSNDNVRVRGENRYFVRSTTDAYFTESVANLSSPFHSGAKFSKLL